MRRRIGSARSSIPGPFRLGMTIPAACQLPMHRRSPGTHLAVSDSSRRFGLHRVDPLGRTPLARSDRWIRLRSEPSVGSGSAWLEPSRIRRETGHRRARAPGAPRADRARRYDVGHARRLRRRSRREPSSRRSCSPGWRRADLGHELIDLGGDGSDPDDDYPDFAQRLGHAIQSRRRGPRHPHLRIRGRGLRGGQQDDRRSARRSATTPTPPTRASNTTT